MSYPGFRAVPHALLEIEDAATVFVAGPPEADKIVFLCAGFPCDHSSFIPLASYLANECGCLVGVSCMPEFDCEGPPHRPEGYDMFETARCFGQGVAALRAQSTSPNAKLILVVHDFGIVPGFAYSNTVGCEKLVVFDVIPANPLEDKPDRVYYALVHANYQSMFALSFRLSRVWAPLGRAWLSIGATLIFGVFRRWLGCTGPRDGWPSRGALGMFARLGDMPWQTPDKAIGASLVMTPFRCNPYWHTLKLAADKEGMDRLSKLISFDESVTKQPVCYLYGEEKNTHFHLNAQLEKLRATPGCEVHGVPDAGHWCYKHAPDFCNQAVGRFISGA